jgi:diguanylate cyclase (GGDEF)-like protein/PAS domain S-box-containing protein
VNRDRPPGFFRRALESSAVAVVLVGEDAVVRYHTPAAADLLRTAGSDLVGELFPGLFTPEFGGSVDSYLQRVAGESDGRSVSMEAGRLLADGHEHWLKITGVNLLRAPAVRGIVLNLADLTDQRRELEQLSRASVVDQLTRVGNRRALQEELAAPRPASVIVIDLDNFRGLNDAFGHAAGDQALAAVARRLQHAFGAMASVFRVGGDEFVAVLPHTPLDSAWVVAERALVAVRAPIGERGLSVTVSMGIARADPGEGLGVLNRADRAMHRAKMAGRGTIALDEAEPEDWQARRTAQRGALEASMRREAELKAEVVRLADRNRQDERTGLLNAAAYSSDINGVDMLARQEGGGYAIALCDVDHFGAYNKHYLFQAANVTLRRVADALRGACRPGDHVYRWGGEELLVVLPDTQLPDARALAERLRGAVEALAIPHENRPPPLLVTISVGVAAFNPEQHASADDVFEDANRQLLKAKQSGRNLVHPPPSHAPIRR